MSTNSAPEMPGGPRSNEQIVEDANALAAEFYGVLGYQAVAGFRFDKSGHPQERHMWTLACIAYEKIHGTDVQAALDEIEEDE